MGYITYIGKVKSHTRATHNDEANTAARTVVEGHISPDVIYTDADPPVGGLRTCPKYEKLARTHHLT